MSPDAASFIAHWIREKVTVESQSEKTTVRSLQMARRLRLEAHAKGISDFELSAAAVALGEPNLAAFISGAIEDAVMMAAGG